MAGFFGIDDGISALEAIQQHTVVVTSDARFSANRLNNFATNHDFIAHAIISDVLAIKEVEGHTIDIVLTMGVIDEGIRISFAVMEELNSAVDLCIAVDTEVFGLNCVILVSVISACFLNSNEPVRSITKDSILRIVVGQNDVLAICEFLRIWGGGADGRHGDNFVVHIVRRDKEWSTATFVFARAIDGDIVAIRELIAMAGANFKAEIGAKPRLAFPDLEVFFNCGQCDLGIFTFKIHVFTSRNSEREAIVAILVETSGPTGGFKQVSRIVIGVRTGVGLILNLEAAKFIVSSGKSFDEFRFDISFGVDLRTISWDVVASFVLHIEGEIEVCSFVFINDDFVEKVLFFNSQADFAGWHVEVISKVVAFDGAISALEVTDARDG